MRISLIRPGPSSNKVAFVRGVRGQALVEFALVLVPLLLIFLGILQFAFIYGTQIGLTNAAREAARYASTSFTATSADATANGPRVMAQLTSTILPNNVQSYYSANLVKSGSPLTRVCYSSYEFPTGSFHVRANVELYYLHPLFMPLISAIIDGLDGAPPDGKFRVGAQVEMPVGNQILTTNPNIINSCTSPP